LLLRDGNAVYGQAPEGADEEGEMKLPENMEAVEDAAAAVVLAAVHLVRGGECHPGCGYLSPWQAHWCDEINEAVEGFLRHFRVEQPEQKETP
jgi:hypothetical protein